MRPEELTQRTIGLVEGLRERLDDAMYAWILENAWQTEWELALADIHLAASSGRLVMTDAETVELSGRGRRRASSGPQITPNIRLIAGNLLEAEVTPPILGKVRLVTRLVVDGMLHPATPVPLGHG